MPDTLMNALREMLVTNEHKLDQLDEIIVHLEHKDTSYQYVEAIGIKDGKAKVIYVPRGCYAPS